MPFMKIPETEGTVHLSPAAGEPKQEEESDYVALPLQNQYDSIFILHTHARSEPRMGPRVV